MEIPLALLLLLLLLILIIAILLLRRQSRKTRSERFSTTTASPDLAAVAYPEEPSCKTSEVKGKDFFGPLEVQVETGDVGEEQIPISKSYTESIPIGRISEQQEGGPTASAPTEPEEGSEVDLRVEAAIVGSEENGTLEQVLDVPSLEAGLESSFQIPESETEDEGDIGTASAAVNFQGLSETPETLDTFETPPAQYPANEDIEVPSRTKERRRGPGIYKPPTLAPPATPSKPPVKKKVSPPEPSDERSLPIAIRAHFQRGGYVRISLLLGRHSQLPEELEITLGGQGITLSALVDEWFQDVMLDSIPADLGQLLQNGIEWEMATEHGKLLRWSLSRRNVYVLAPSNSLSGFISTTRLVIGEEHVVLCAQDLLESVLAVIDETGSPSPDVLTSSQGVSNGWVCLRHVAPQRAVPQTEGQDILNILRPLPDLDLAFENGIRLERSVWLAGYPPKIHLRGDLSTVGRVVIDGKEASPNTDGAYTVPGWDLPDDHIIWAGGRSWSYSIREVSDEWDIWEAYSFPVQLSQEVDIRRLALCGPVVLQPDKDDKNRSLYPVIVPASNPVLVGAVPGQICLLQFKPNEKSAAFGGYVPFQPIWALPADPYHSDKSVVKVLLLSEGKPAHWLEEPHWLGQAKAAMVRDWADTLLAAGRKGLAVEPDSATAKVLWNNYKRQAKMLWRALR